MQEVVSLDASIKHYPTCHDITAHAIAPNQYTALAVFMDLAKATTTVLKLCTFG